MDPLAIPSDYSTTNSLIYYLTIEFKFEILVVEKSLKLRDFLQLLSIISAVLCSRKSRGAAESADQITPEGKIIPFEAFMLHHMDQPYSWWFDAEAHERIFTVQHISSAREPSLASRNLSSVKITTNLFFL